MRCHGTAHWREVEISDKPCAQLDAFGSRAIGCAISPSRCIEGGDTTAGSCAPSPDELRSIAARSRQEREGSDAPARGESCTRASSSACTASRCASSASSTSSSSRMPCSDSHVRSRPSLMYRCMSLTEGLHSAPYRQSRMSRRGTMVRQPWYRCRKTPAASSPKKVGSMFRAASARHRCCTSRNMKRCSPASDAARPDACPAWLRMEWEGVSKKGAMWGFT
mmetsp:Transcript_35096/g.113060  ORF Transcript_35096/g.113060 Transcript_35096/m.113060 type:complete len:222 (+) Transcript_35096:663-1328(+)